MTHEQSKHNCEQRAHPKALESHAFLELMNYSSRRVLRFNLPSFDMIVIDTGSRFTFKVDLAGRVDRTITKRTK